MLKGEIQLPKHSVNQPLAHKSIIWGTSLGGNHFFNSVPAEGTFIISSSVSEFAFRPAALIQPYLRLQAEMSHLKCLGCEDAGHSACQNESGHGKHCTNCYGCWATYVGIKWWPLPVTHDGNGWWVEICRPSEAPVSRACWDRRGASPDWQSVLSLQL